MEVITIKGDWPKIVCLFSCKIKSEATKPWLKRRVGIASCLHGNGLGNNLEDDAEAMVQLTDEGRFSVMVSNEYMGQGAYTSLLTITGEVLGISLEKIDFICGNNKFAPNSGPSTEHRV